MADKTPEQLVRDCLTAYATDDRQLIEAALGDDFTFTSPYDDHINRAEYFERCWSQRHRIKSHDVEKILVEGDAGFVLYTLHPAEGESFRNTEFFNAKDGKLASIEVFFGALPK